VRHHTKDKGDVGLAFVIADLMSQGIQVALPISEHLPFDCIAIAGDGAMSRLSVKYRAAAKGLLEVRLRSSWSDREGVHSRLHARGDYDALAVYCPEAQGCYYLRVDEVDGSTVVLRFAIPRNGQVAGVRMAEDYREPARLFVSPR
jgi:hypothetical protein